MIRTSKYRHVYATPFKRDHCYENVKLSGNYACHTEGSLFKVNQTFLALNWDASGGGLFSVIPLHQVGRFLPSSVPLITAHEGPIIDLAFSPFDAHLLATSSEDTTVAIWKIPPEGFPTNPVSASNSTITLQNNSAITFQDPLFRLQGHTKKVHLLQFHPTAKNLLVSASADLSIRFWDLNLGIERLCLSGQHPDTIFSISFNYNGSLMVTSCKDKKIRLFELPSGKVLGEAVSHQGIKASHTCWLGQTNYFLTTGFSKTLDRQIMIWDSQNLKAPLKVINVDTSSGILVPYFDPDTSLLYVWGKGDGNIRYYEFVDKEPFLYYLSEYKSSDPQRFVTFMPTKIAFDFHKNEIARAYKVSQNMIEPLSFKVPRKSDSFQEDIYPPTVGDEAPLTCEEFFLGKKADPILINLKKYAANHPVVDITNNKNIVPSHSVDFSRIESVQEKTFSKPSVHSYTYSSLSFQSYCPNNELSLEELLKRNEELMGIIAEQTRTIEALSKQLSPKSN